MHLLRALSQSTRVHKSAHQWQFVSGNLRIDEARRMRQKQLILNALRRAGATSREVGTVLSSPCRISHPFRRPALSLLRFAARNCTYFQRGILLRLANRETSSLR